MCMWTLLCNPWQVACSSSQASDLCGECRLGCTGVEDVGYKIHVGNQSRLYTMNGRQLQTCFEGGHFCVADAAGSAHPAQAFFRDLKHSIASENAAHRGERGCIEAPVRLLV